MGSVTFIAWVGTDDHLNVGLVDEGSVRCSLRLDERTFYEPGLVVHAGALLLVWTGIKGEVGVTQLRTPTVAGVGLEMMLRTCAHWATVGRGRWWPGRPQADSVSTVASLDSAHNHNHPAAPAAPRTPAWCVASAS